MLVWIQFWRGGPLRKSGLSRANLWFATKPKVCAWPGAKPSSTSAVVFRPPSRRTESNLFKRDSLDVLRFLVWDSFWWPYHHTENTEITQKHGKYWHSVECLLYLPRPHTEPTEINGMHEKGAGVELWENLSRNRDVTGIFGCTSVWCKGWLWIRHIQKIGSILNDKIPNTSISRKDRILQFIHPGPHFVHSVDFRGFRVGAGEGTTCIQSNRFFLFPCFCVISVFSVWWYGHQKESRTRNRSTSGNLY